MSNKRRIKKAHRAQRRPAEVTSVARSVAVTSPTIVWEAHVFGAGVYQTASRFLLQGLLAEGAPTDLARVIWSAPLRDATGYADEARNFVLGLDGLGTPLRAESIH